MKDILIENLVDKINELLKSPTFENARLASELIIVLRKYVYFVENSIT